MAGSRRGVASRFPKNDPLVRDRIGQIHPSRHPNLAYFGFSPPVFFLVRLLLAQWMASQVQKKLILPDYPDSVQLTSSHPAQ